MNNKKRVFSILFELIIIVLLYFLIINNSDFNYFFNKNDNNSKFIKLDIKTAKETRFSISDKNKEQVIIYYIDKDKRLLLLELVPSTVLTNKVELMYMDDKPESKELKIDIKREEDINKDFEKGYYTNLNINYNLNIIKFKFYSCIGLGFVTLFLMFIDFIKIIKKKSK